MKATGIVRKLDELGRIVIPKEIRKTFSIPNNCALEVFIRDDDTIVLRHFKPNVGVNEVCRVYADVLSEQLGVDIFLTDGHEVVYATGVNKKNWTGEKIFKTNETAFTFNITSEQGIHGQLFIPEALHDVQAQFYLIDVAIRFFHKRLSRLAIQTV